MIPEPTMVLLSSLALVGSMMLLPRRCRKESIR